mmetsp:Transcript_89193/g.186395  ORF Transcript_89193/g.186395 Transcript_89193/m.186395 type:complete len:120 (+) Transcript_89193:278-637(+)
MSGSSPLRTTGSSALATIPMYTSHNPQKPVPGYLGHTPKTWSAVDGSFAGHHERFPDRVFDYHIEGYAGHQPLNWSNKKKSQTRTRSLPASRAGLPTAARTALDTNGLWFGSIGKLEDW